jgi:hypothetical protein
MLRDRFNLKLNSINKILIIKICITMITKIYISKGCFAADDAALKAKREALKNNLLNGKKVIVKKDGNVMDDKSQSFSQFIPKGVFAADDAALKAKREALKKKLMEGGKVTLKKDGNVMDDKGQDASISIPKGKLASQWYESDPQLLGAEKAAMHQCFPHFTLNRLDDGRLYWMGELTPAIYETKFRQRKTYTVMAVYNNNHPEQVMGSSVRIYPVLPDVDDLIRDCGFRPYHLLRDSTDNLYLCTNEADNVSTGNTVTTAAAVLAWAVKWLSCYELVLTGDLTKEKFNQHGGI